MVLSASFAPTASAAKPSHRTVAAPRAARSTPALALPRAGDLLAGAMMIGVGLGLPLAADAKLPSGLSQRDSNPYADVMKSKTTLPSAEDLYAVSDGS